MLAQSDAWVGLEARTCDAAPFDSTGILSTHSQLATYIAGFALAGFILLLSRDGKGDASTERAHGNASLMLALAAITGMVCAFLFSSMAGFRCLTVQTTAAYASPLLIVSALLAVAGISVLAAASPRIGNTATSLRLLLLIGAVLMGGRLFLDYQRVEQTSRAYRDVVHQVGAIQDADPGGGPRVTPGSTTSLDRQLGIYAEDRWPDRPDEWPSLLASHLFQQPTNDGFTAVLVVIVLIGAASGITAAFAMRSTGERGPPRPGSERRWRGWLSGTVAVLTITCTILFAAGLGQGDELVAPPSWHWAFGLVASLSVLLLAVQPPLVDGQRSVISAGRATLRYWRASYVRARGRMTRD